MTYQGTNAADETPEHLREEIIAARARALSSPVRWRVLRACLDQALTNKELADRLGVNPGSMLHHVRTLVATGFLEAEDVRRGARNAVEIPYRTTELALTTARTSVGFGDLLLGDAEAEESSGDAGVWQASLRLDRASEADLRGRLDELMAEFQRRGEGLLDEHARTVSIVVSLRASAA